MTFATAVTLLPLVACASAGDAHGDSSADGSPDPVLAEMGESIFIRYCAACHGASARGDGPAAEVLRVPPSDLTRIAQRHGGSFPDGAVARTIDGRFDYPAHGSREMPVWGERFGDSIPEASLSEEVARGKVVTIVEYLKSIQQSD